MILKNKIKNFAARYQMKFRKYVRKIFFRFYIFEAKHKEKTLLEKYFKNSIYQKKL